MCAFLGAVATSPTQPAAFDWAGQVLAVVGLATLVYGLIDGGHAGFASPPVVVSLAVAMLALTGFVMVQARVAHPMMPLELFRARGFRLALPVGFAFMVGNYGNVFVVSLYLQQQLGLSPLHAGLVFLPSALCVIPVAAGGALAMPSVTSVVLEGVTAQQAGTASAVFNTFRQVGGAVAIAVFGALVAKPDHIDRGLRHSLGTAAVLLLLAALSSLHIRRRAQDAS